MNEANHGVYQNAEHFSTTLHRIMRATGCGNQAELANFLRIRQSAVSAARRDGFIPDSWLLELAVRLQVSPHWILTGEASTSSHDNAAPDAHHNLEHVPLEALIAETSRRIRHLRELCDR